MRLATILLLAPLLFAQERPKILGVAHIALSVSDIGKSRAFYKDFLGYQEPFSLNNPDGSLSLTFIKVNDRQYIELFPKLEPGADRLKHISIQTDDAEAMRRYLASHGVKVPASVPKGRIRNSNFNIQDPDGHTVEIVQYEPDGWSMREKGKYMSDARISNRILHLGIIVGELETAMQFYGRVLGFREIWRGSKDGKVLSWVNMKVPDGDDYLEFMLYDSLPAPDERGSQHHIALEVPDIAKSVAALEARPYRKQYGRAMDIRVGTNRKRQMNLYDPDGTRIELMEPNTVDGKPAPPSTAPPPPTISIEEYTPKSTLVVSQHPVTRAKFPFIDVHNHQQGTMPQAKLDKLVADMDKLNMRVMVNLSGGYGDKLQQAVANMKGHYPDRFIVFANIDFTRIDDPDYPKRAAAQLEQDVKNGAQGLKIFKNFGMDLKDTKGQRIHVDDPRFDQLFETCARLKIPVLIHTGEPAPFFQPQDKFNERWLELKTHPGRARPPEKYPTWETLMTEQHNLFAKHPTTTFINAHLGWLGGNLAELGRLMDQLPNMYTEIGAVLAELGRQPRAARQFFIQHQDRVLFGKDVWAPAEYYTYFRVLETADEYFDYYRHYHAFWQMYGLDLPDDVLKKLYYQNALRILPGINPAGFP